MASSRRSSYAVSIRGYSAFRRGLRRLDKGVALELSRYVREITNEVRDEARSRTPVGRTGRRSDFQPRAGNLKRSIRSSSTMTRSSIYSDAPYAALIEWGGTGKRWPGSPVEFEGRHMIVSAVEDKSEEVEAHMVRMFDSISRTSGF